MPRPNLVKDLLTEDVTYETWDVHNKNKARYYIVNFEHLFARPGFTINYLKEKHAQSVGDEINKIEWKTQYPAFEWDKFAPNQLDKLDKTQGPYVFEKAAMVILTIELGLRAIDPSIDIYDPKMPIQILPASFYIDGFDNDALKELRRSDKDFNAKAIKHAGQRAYADPSKDLLHYMAQKGFCVTRYVADKILEYVETNHAGLVDIGPVKHEPDGRLGRGHAPADRLKVPRNIIPPPTDSDAAEEGPAIA